MVPPTSSGAATVRRLARLIYSFMQFREFLEANVLNLSTDDIPEAVPTEIEGSPAFIADFEVAGRDYQVIFKQAPIGIEDGQHWRWLMENAYEIDFFGPQGMELTGLGNAHEIYTKMLLVVKKFVDQHKPLGLEFLPYVDRMLPVYERFFKRYGQDYWRIERSTLVRKDYVARGDEEFQKLIANAVRRTAQTDFLSDIRQQANQERMQKQRLKPAMGKIVLAKINDVFRAVVLQSLRPNQMADVRDAEGRTMFVLPQEIKPVNWLNSWRVRQELSRLQALGLSVWTG